MMQIVQVTLTRERRLPEKQEKKLDRGLVAEKFVSTRGLSGRRSFVRRKRGCRSVRGRKTSLLRGLFVYCPRSTSCGARERLPSGSSEKGADDGKYNVKDSNLCTRREGGRLGGKALSHPARGISASGYHAALFSSGAAAGWELKVWVGVEGDVRGANHRPTSHGGWQRRRRRVPAGVDASLRDGREVGPVRFCRAARGRPWRNFQCILVGVSLLNRGSRRWEDPT